MVCIYTRSKLKIINENIQICRLHLKNIVNYLNYVELGA
jgi:hypothetical protein